MRAVLVLAAGIMLAGCFGEEFGDLKAELKEKTKELRGKRVNILNYGGSNDLALQLALKEWSLKLSDIQVIVGGDAYGSGSSRVSWNSTGRACATSIDALMPAT